MTADLDLDGMEALAKAATPGVWEYDRYSVAGVTPEYFGEGRCVDCGQGTPLLWTGKRDINGKRMLAHAHVHEPYGHHDIVTFNTKTGYIGTVIGNYDYEVGGVVSEADAEFILAAQPETVLAMVARIRQLEKQVAHQLHVVIDTNTHPSPSVKLVTCPRCLYAHPSGAFHQCPADRWGR